MCVCMYVRESLSVYVCLFGCLLCVDVCVGRFMCMCVCVSVRALRLRMCCRKAADTSKQQNDSTSETHLTLASTGDILETSSEWKTSSSV